MSIKSEIERLNNTVAEQAGLIEEIIGALEGKINPPPITEFAAKYGWVRYPVSDNPTAYIQSSGTQYIDTGFIPDSNTRIVMDCEILEFKTTAYFGVCSASSGAMTAAPTNTLLIESGNKIRHDWHGTSASYSGVITGRHIVDCDKNKVIINGNTLITNGNANNKSAYTMYLLARKVGNTNTADLYSKAKLYSCKIYNNTTMVHYFIPTKDPNGVFCLFDYCTGKYFYNGGTGTFSGSTEIKPIEESYVCSDNENAYHDNEIIDGYFYKKLPLPSTETVPSVPTYAIADVSGASYGFALSGNYYVSQNGGKNNSASVCRVDFNCPGPATAKVYCISYGENKYDFGILSNLDTALSTSYTEDTSNVYKSFKGLSSTSEQLVTYSIPAGNHYIYIKYRKDSSGNSYDDTLKFRIELSAN